MATQKPAAKKPAVRTKRTTTAAKGKKPAAAAASKNVAAKAGAKTNWKVLAGVVVAAVIVATAAIMVGQSEASASCRSKTLKQGSTGSCVKVVQKYFGLKQDGIFGKNTKAKVVAFQQGFKLSADGIVGPKTWSKMCSVLKPGVSAHKSMAKSIGCTLTGNGSVYYK